MKDFFKKICEWAALAAICAANPISTWRIRTKRWGTRIMSGAILGFVPYHEAATAAVKEILGPDWSFGFETFESATVGRCYYNLKRITISWEYAMDELGSDGDGLVKTTLHEIAHGLAWEWYGDGLHGLRWSLFCRLLGIPGESPNSPIRLFAGSRARGYLYYPELNGVQALWTTPDYKDGRIYVEGERTDGAHFLTWRELVKKWPELAE